MDLFDRISADIKAAMLAREKVRLETLRGIKKEFDFPVHWVTIPTITGPKIAENLPKIL